MRIRPVRRQRLTRPDDTTSRPIVLAVRRGPRRGARHLARRDGPTRALLGQSPVCTLRLTDREVSRRHAALTVTDTKLVVLDLGSTNGTTVNGVSSRKPRSTAAKRSASVAPSSRCSAERPAPSTSGRRRSFGRVVGESPAMKRLYPGARAARRQRPARAPRRRGGHRQGARRRGAPPRERPHRRSVHHARVEHHPGRRARGDASSASRTASSSRRRAASSSSTRSATSRATSQSTLREHDGQGARRPRHRRRRGATSIATSPQGRFDDDLFFLLAARPHRAPAAPRSRGRRRAPRAPLLEASSLAIGAGAGRDCRRTSSRASSTTRGRATSASSAAPSSRA